MTERAFPWFDRFANLEEVLRTLIEDEEQNGGTWGFGAKSAPMRSYLIGYVALELGKVELAAPALKRALEFEGFNRVKSQLRQAVQRCQDS
jgi:hypothetical protein